MMKTLLLSLLLALPILASAQRSLPSDLSSRMQPGRVPSLQKVAADTLFPSVLLEDCFQFIEPYFTQDTGFVLGSNIYSDIAQLQRIVNTRSSSFEVNSVEVPVFLADSTAFDIYLSAVIFSEVDENGVPGEFLGRSDSLRVGDFNRDTTGGLINFTEFVFSNPVPVENDSFLIGIDFSNAYSTTSVEFIGLYGTPFGCGDGNNVVQASATNSGVVFGTVAEYYGGANLEIPMYVAVENLTTSLGSPASADYRVQVSPNPTPDNLRLRFEAPTRGQYAVVLTDLTGRQLRSAVYPSTTQSVQVDWDISDLPTGLYLYHIDGPSGRQSGKVIKR